MNAYMFIAIIMLILFIFAALSLYFTARCFFRFIILRKTTSTLNNIIANNDRDSHIEFILKRIDWLNKQKTEDIFIKSDDGLTLHGTLLKSTDNANCVICFHGYTSKGTSDYGTIAKFYNEQNFNIIMTDARAHGKSEGEYIGFGVLDRFDAKKWIDYAIERFGENVNIFLHGDSMGGATVLMAGGLNLPKNVKGIISDCAFTSAYDIFSYILKRDYHIPEFPIMNLTELITKKRAGYGYHDVNTLTEVSKTNIPILFIHGDKDAIVPTYMTEQNYNACKSEKELLIVKDADHTEAYYTDTAAYENAVKNFIKKYS